MRLIAHPIKNYVAIPLLNLTFTAIISIKTLMYSEKTEIQVIITAYFLS